MSVERTEVTDIIKILNKQQNRVQGLSLMTRDNCPADKAYKSIESAIEWLADAIGEDLDALAAELNLK